MLLLIPPWQLLLLLLLLRGGLHLPSLQPLLLSAPAEVAAPTPAGSSAPTVLVMRVVVGALDQGRLAGLPTGVAASTCRRRRHLRPAGCRRCTSAAHCARQLARGGPWVAAAAAAAATCRLSCCVARRLLLPVGRRFREERVVQQLRPVEALGGLLL